MVSSKKKDIKRKIVKKVVKKKNNFKKEINNLKEEYDEKVIQIISSTVYKKDIQASIDRINNECKKSRTFLKSLETTVAIEKTKISEFEGAVLALHEVLTGEKINKIKKVI